MILVQTRFSRRKGIASWSRRGNWDLTFLSIYWAARDAVVDQIYMGQIGPIKLISCRLSRRWIQSIAFGLLCRVISICSAPAQGHIRPISTDQVHIWISTMGQDLRDLQIKLKLSINEPGSQDSKPIDDPFSVWTWYDGIDPFHKSFRIRKPIRLSSFSFANMCYVPIYALIFIGFKLFLQSRVSLRP